jgi:LCP family protein required for cell wall assembly
MNRRAAWLVGLNIAIPGSAQLIAGNRRFGRFAVSTTFVLWALVVLGVILWFVARFAIYAVVTSMVGLTVLQLLLAAYAVLWVVLALDTLRLARLIKISRELRAALAVVAIGAVVLTAGTAGYAAASAGSARSAIAKIFTATATVAPTDGRYNIMLLGGDAGPDRTGLRPDSLSVASVDATTGKTTIIGIPRNTERVRFVAGSPLYGPFPDGYDCGDLCLIDYLYTYGEEHPDLYPKATAQGSSSGIEAMRDAAEGMLGIKIQFYALIDMQGFADLVDALGGVEIDVPAALPYGPVTSTRPIGVFQQGEQHMNGASALWYARSRFDGNDYERMARQRVVQQAIIAQFQPSVVLSKFQAIAAAGAQVVKTNVPSSMLPFFVDLADKGRKLPVTDLELVPPTFNPAYPDYAAIDAAVQAAIAPITSSPSPSR